MITVIIARTDEPEVILMTQENIIRELYSVHGEIMVANSWWEGLKQTKTPYVSLVEPDCLISSGYYASMIGLFKKNNYYRKLAMISSAVGVRNFANRIFNYEMRQGEWSDEFEGIKTRGSWHIEPNKDKRSSGVYPTQVGFVPGAVIRTSALLDALSTDKKIPGARRNLVELSTRLSFYFWSTGRRVAVNPNTTYVSNEDYLAAPPEFNPRFPAAIGSLFAKEGI